MRFEVTLKQLRKKYAGLTEYNKIVSALRGIEFDDERETYIRFKHDEPISLISILETNGLDDALWCLRCNSNWDRDSRLFAVWSARQVQYLMTDERSIKALDVAERFANGNASEEELYAAWSAARDAAMDATDATAVSDAAKDAAWAAVSAAFTNAWSAAWSAASDADNVTAWSAQKEMFIKMCNGEAPWQVV